MKTGDRRLIQTRWATIGLDRQLGQQKPWAWIAVSVQAGAMGSKASMLFIKAKKRQKRELTAREGMG